MRFSFSSRSLLASHTSWRRHRSYLFVLLMGVTALGMLIGSCAVNPVTNRPDLVLTTVEGERNIGEKAAREVEESMGLTTDPKLAAYVESVGQRLAVHSPRKDIEYHFYVVEMVEPNAFALPGGFIYISRGLLALANTEDELANVIGHEIGHVAARHSVQSISAAAPFSIVGGLAGAVTGMVSDRLSTLVTGVTGLTSRLLLSPYSREQERQADEVGIEIAAASGWDPAGMSTFLRTLEREEKLKNKGPRKVSFFDSHPSLPERVGTTAEQAREVSPPGSQLNLSDRSTFLKRLNGLVVGPHSEAGVFVNNLFLQPDLDFSVRFPSEWETVNSRQAVAAVDKELAVLSLLQIESEGNDPIIQAQTFTQRIDSELLEKIDRFKVGSLPAARIILPGKTEHGPIMLDLTWIAYKGHVYKVTGISPLKLYESYAATFFEIVQSFRPLTLVEQAEIPIVRLRLVHAREGETLTQILSRTGSTWNVDEAAIANGLSNDAILHQGQLVKVAKRERYLSVDVKD